MKKLLIITLLLQTLTCLSQKKDKIEGEIIQEEIADLNNDGIPEKIQVINYFVLYDFEKISIKGIKIFKKKKGEWKVWRNYSRAITWRSDSFNNIKISNAILTINYNTKKRSNYSDFVISEKYRLIGNHLKLIKFSSRQKYYRDNDSYNYFLTYEINYINGLVTYNKEYINKKHKIKNERESFNLYVKKYNLKDKIQWMRIYTPRYKRKLKLKT